MCCTECIDKGIWNRSFNQNELCRICGPNRTFCWSSFDLPEHLQADVHIPVPDEENLVPSFVKWLLEFEQKKMSYIANPEELPNLEEAAEELHPGIDEEDEVQWELGLGMAPRRGEDDNGEDDEDDENADEAVEVNGGEEGESGVANIQRAKKGKKKEAKQKIPHYETLVYAHCGGR